MAVSSIGNTTNSATTQTPTGTWTAVASPGGSQARRFVTFVNGLWITGGDFGYIASAPDPSGPWSASGTLPFGSAGNTNVWRADVGGGYCVAVSSGSPYLRYATSVNGTWATPTTAPPSAMYGVKYTAGTWVAVGVSAVYTATDPTGTWTSRTVTPTTGQMSGQIDFDGTYYAVGADGTAGNTFIYTATDPTGTWTGGSAGFSTNAQVRGLAYGGGYWVAGSVGGQLRYATDPTGTWTAVGTNPLTTIIALAYRDGVWLVGGATGSGTLSTKIAYATDPTGTWTVVGTYPNYNERVWGIAIGGNSIPGNRSTLQAVKRAAVF